MPQTEKVPVLLDKQLVSGMLNGILQGARRKALKIVVSANGNFYIESKELRMVLSTDDSGKVFDNLTLQNEKQYAVITAGTLHEMSLDKLANDVITEINDKYSPCAHSLADSLYVFARQYGNS